MEDGTLIPASHPTPLMALSARKAAGKFPGMEDAGPTYHLPCKNGLLDNPFRLSVLSGQQVVGIHELKPIVKLRPLTCR